VLELNVFPALFQKLFDYRQLARKRGTQFMVTQSIRYRIDKGPGVAQILVHGTVDGADSQHNHIDLGYP
jgi:hypothetical protein